MAIDLKQAGPVLALTVVVWACAGGPPTADETAAPVAEAAGGSFSVGLPEPVGIEPVTMADLYGYQVMRLVFDGLTEISEDLEVVPAMAQSWDVNEDNTVFTFHLRDDVRFSNGRPVTAQDFVFGWNRVADPESAANVAYHGLPIKGWGEVMEGAAEAIEGVQAVDDQTLEITTAQPFVLLPMVLAHPVFSPIPEEEVGEGFSDQPVGNGPYMMDGPWQHNQGMTLVRNPEYYAEPGVADSIEVLIYSEFETTFRDTQAGNLDIAYDAVPPEEIESAQAEFGDRLLVVPVGALDYLGLPVQHAPFDNVDIRRALSMAIDREAIAESIYQGTRVPARSMVPSLAPAGVEDACPYCVFDPEEAKALLDSAGGIPGGSVKLYYPTGDEAAEQALQAAANGWGTHLGVEVEFQGMEFSPFVDLLYEGITDGMHAIGWIWDYPSAYSFLSPLLESTSGDNLVGYASPEFDALLQEVRTAETIEAGYPALEEAQRLEGEELPIIPLHFTTSRTAYSERVTNVTVDALGTIYLERVAVTGS